MPLFYLGIEDFELKVRLTETLHDFWGKIALECIEN